MILAILVAILILPQITLLYKDGGSSVTWSPLYVLIHWNQDENAYHDMSNGWEIHFIPNNYRNPSIWRD